jgi:hypothetical protein
MNQRYPPLILAIDDEPHELGELASVLGAACLASPIRQGHPSD